MGEAIAGIPRDKVQILTKYGLRWDLKSGEFHFKSKDNDDKTIDIYKYAGRESIIQECENSLQRLKTDYIDLYQIHWADITTPIGETMETMALLIKQGKIRHAGVCNYNVAQMIEAEKYINLVSNQIPYSMVKREIETEVVPHCIQSSTSILAYSPLERGLLTGKMKPGHKFEERDHRANLYFFSDENIRRTSEFLDKIKPMAISKDITLSQLVLSWTLAQPGITIALAGARNADQAVSNAKAGDILLSVDEINVINGHLADLTLLKP